MVKLWQLSTVNLGMRWKVSSKGVYQDWNQEDSTVRSLEKWQGRVDSPWPTRLNTGTFLVVSEHDYRCPNFNGIRFWWCSLCNSLATRSPLAETCCELRWERERNKEKEEEREWAWDRGRDNQWERERILLIGGAFIILNLNFIL